MRPLSNMNSIRVRPKGASCANTRAPQACRFIITLPRVVGNPVAPPESRGGAGDPWSPSERLVGHHPGAGGACLVQRAPGYRKQAGQWQANPAACSA